MNVTGGTENIWIFYDATGPFVIKYGDVDTYHYELNMQGDIIAILDSSGNRVVEYTYDAWGKLLSISGSMKDDLGQANPLRYRGYVYDHETGLYYCQSRYYDPEIGRWLNADSYAATGNEPLDCNMFAYCGNNPVMYTDSTGYAPEWWQWAFSGAMIVAGVVLVATGTGGVAGGALICAGANSMIGSYTSELNGNSSVAGWAGGLATGAACGIGAGYAGALLVEASKATGFACLGYLAAGETIAFSSGALGSAVGQGISAVIDGMELDTKEVLYSSVTTGVINCLSSVGAGMG